MPRTQDELSAAFDLVKNSTHWKKPINARVALTDEQVDAVHEAVIHFTGSIATITNLPNGKRHVRAAGYYATIGA
jgi:hypothetical protein